MDILAFLFDVNQSMFHIIDYPVSFLEFSGTLLGLISVYLATRANIHTWTTGVFNVMLFFILYYQIRLYSDMLLQIFFLIMSFLGYHSWQKGKEESSSYEISYMHSQTQIILIVLLIFNTYIIGNGMAQVHVWLPTYFPEKASFPYFDAFTTVLSIAATFLMIRKRIECWVLWILVDVVSIGIYLQKGVLFIAMEYLVFLMMAIAGLVNWIKTERECVEV